MGYVGCMTNPITILNFGACPRKAIELIGHTTKDGQGTIGRFGSGTAYAIALAIRRGVGVTISSHDEDGPYTMQPYGKPINVGDRMVTQVMWRYRRGSPLMPTWWDSAAQALSRPRSVPTSFTADLGQRDWNGAFPIVREFISNAKDAGTWQLGGDIGHFMERARVAGHTAITAVQIDDPSGACQAVIDAWDEHFRFNERGTIFSRNGGFSAIHPKSEVSPLRVFVRGVRCPWPDAEVPDSMFDYSLEVELNEARSLKNPWMAAHAMTTLWNDAVTHDPAIGSSLLIRLDGNDSAWETSAVNEYAARSGGGGWATAWRSVHGHAPVAGQADPAVPGAVRTTDSMRAFLSSSGVATAKSRTVEVKRGDTTFVEVPSKEASMVLEITMQEADELKQLLTETARLPRVRDLLP